MERGVSTWQKAKPPQGEKKTPEQAWCWALEWLFLSCFPRDLTRRPSQQLRHVLPPALPLRDWGPRPEPQPWAGASSSLSECLPCSLPPLQLTAPFWSKLSFLLFLLLQEALLD